MAIPQTTKDGAPDTKPATPVRRLYKRALDHHRAGRLDEAIKDYTDVVRLAALPTLSADLYNNLGVALRAQGRAHAALACYRRALTLRPKAADIYTNLGHVLRDLGKPTQAAEAHRRAVKYAPESPKLLLNAGLALRDAGQTSAALQHFNRAIKHDPTYALAQVEHARTRLSMGDWTTGFKALETRFALPGRNPRRSGIPAWNGEPLNNKTILINFEGGEGATLQFSRFTAALKHKGARVIMECPAHMAHVFKAMPSIDATLNLGASVSAIDVQVPLFSLGTHLDLQVDTLLAEKAYLSAPNLSGPKLDIPAQTRLVVGLAWSGGWSGRPVTGPARPRDIPLQELDALFSFPDIHLVSLERGQGTHDIVRLGLQPLINAIGSSIMDVADMALIIEQLDLVICVDSVAAHVAGAMGKPVWMLVPPGTDWCWLLDRDDSPWYPSMRIFRKSPDQPWAAVADSVRQALADVLKGAA